MVKATQWEEAEIKYYNVGGSYIDRNIVKKARRFLAYYQSLVGCVFRVWIRWWRPPSERRLKKILQCWRILHGQKYCEQSQMFPGLLSELGGMCLSTNEGYKPLWVLLSQVYYHGIWQYRHVHKRVSDHSFDDMEGRLHNDSDDAYNNNNNKCWRTYCKIVEYKNKFRATYFKI